MVEWKIKNNGLVLARNYRNSLTPIAKMRKCLNWETCLSKEMYCNSNVSQTGVWRWSPPPPEPMGVWGFGGFALSRWAIFRNLLENASLIPLDHILHLFRATVFEITRFFTFESQLKKLSYSSPPFACNLSPKHV